MTFNCSTTDRMIESLIDNIICSKKLKTSDVLYVFQVSPLMELHSS